MSQQQLSRRRRAPMRVLVAGLLSAAGSAAVLTATAAPAWACHIGFEFGSVQRLADGYHVDVTTTTGAGGNASNMIIETDAGTATLSATSWNVGDTPVRATVTGLNPGQSATIGVNGDIVGSSRCPSPFPFTARALATAAANPTTGPVTRTADGFTFTVTNYDTDTYEYTYTVTNDATVTDDGSGAVTVTGLAEGDSATVTVTATPKDPDAYSGTGTKDVTSSALAAEPEPSEPPAATRPSAPRTPSVTGGDGSVTVRWAAPARNGSRITGYLVTATPGGRSRLVGPDTTRAIVAGLTNGVSYRFTVVAQSTLGSSEPSDPSEAVTPVDAADKSIAVDRPRAEPGSTVTFTGTGYEPGSSVNFTLYSDPVFLGSAVADGKGVATLTVELPRDLTGSHTVRAVGQGPDGPLSQDIRFTVAERDRDRGDGLPVTGPGATGTLVVALGLLLGGLALLAAVRRRRADG